MLRWRVSGFQGIRIFCVSGSQGSRGFQGISASGVTDPSCTAATVVPLPPQSMTSDEARPDAKLVSTGFLARKMAGGACFSNSSCTIFSRPRRVVCTGSPGVQGGWVA